MLKMQMTNGLSFINRKPNAYKLKIKINIEWYMKVHDDKYIYYLFYYHSKK